MIVARRDPARAAGAAVEQPDIEVIACKVYRSGQARRPRAHDNAVVDLVFHAAVNARDGKALRDALGGSHDLSQIWTDDRPEAEGGVTWAKRPQE